MWEKKWYSCIKNWCLHSLSLLHSRGSCTLTYHVDCFKVNRMRTDVSADIRRVNLTDLCTVCIWNGKCSSWSNGGDDSGHDVGSNDAATDDAGGGCNHDCCCFYCLICGCGFTTIWLCCSLLFVFYESVRLIQSQWWKWKERSLVSVSKRSSRTGLEKCSVSFLDNRLRGYPFYLFRVCVWIACWSFINYGSITKLR